MIHREQVGPPLAVPQLAHVVVPAARPFAPAEKAVARALRKSLPGNDAPAVVAERRPAHVRLEHRRLGLLHLEDDPVTLRVVRGLHQADPAPRADAAHASHAVRGVDEPEAADERALIVGEARGVVVEHGLDVVEAVLGVVEVDDERRVVDEAQRAVVVARVPSDRTPMVLA